MYALQMQSQHMFLYPVTPTQDKVLDCYIIPTVGL